METAQLLDSVVRKVQDASYSEDDILGLLNEALMEVASGGDRQHGNATLAPLPYLFAQEEVMGYGDGEGVELPDDFLRDVVRVEWNGNKLKPFHGQIRAFLDRYSGGYGSPSAYCVVGKHMLVGPASTSMSTFRVYYYRKPSMLNLFNSPDCIPEHLQARLLVNYVCREIFQEGVKDGETEKAARHDMEYQRALTDLERVIGSADGETVNVADDHFTEDMII